LLTAPPRQKKAPAAPEPRATAPAAKSKLTVVGIGASAGGLEACSQLLEQIPSDTGMAFVLVQHLSPKHVSALPTLLGSSTRMAVEQVTEGVRLGPNRVFIIPPDTQMALSDGSLHLRPRPEGRSQHTPIDHFFSSLARDCGERAIAVILSGTASDGAQGVRDIKAAGGIAIAQDPATAHYGGMPHAAIATGLVDIIASPSEIAHHLVEISRHAYIAPVVATPAEDAEPGAEDLQRIFTLLRGAKGVDFSLYKPPTIRRRIQRRMALNKIDDMETYIAHLKDNISEVDALYHDILIQVTHFFREPEALEALTKDIFPILFASRPPDLPARIWVPGCATGEEVYSIAIGLIEFLDKHAAGTPIQIFGTDVSEAAIEYARTGLYPQSIAEHVSAERLRRFFTPGDGSYRIAKKVRDLCIFARQDLSRDPPFSRLDLIVCRNVLIYLGAPLQKKLMTVFHYALRPTGFLVLGKAETVGPNTDLFTIVNKKHRIYSRKHKDLSTAALFASEIPVHRESEVPRPVPQERANSVLSQASQALLERYAPPGVVVSSNMQIVQFRGQTGPYLEPAPGNASLNLLKMAREGLLYGLRTALHAARKRGVPVRKDGLRVKSNGGFHLVSIEVFPLGSMDQERHYLIAFHEGERETAAAAAAARASKARPSASKNERQVVRLQQELAASRDYLQSMIQDLEAANEELQSANEEILSSNEELQSTNEELDTAKEELQSINEELNTVNEELHGRNEELSRVNSDLVNLLSNVHLAIVMVSADLRIRRFTPIAEKVLNLIPGDIGRPIGNIQPNFDFQDLQQTIAEVIDTVTLHQRDVQDRQGHWYQVVIRPYKNMMNQIDGAVLALYDIDSARRKEQPPAHDVFSQMAQLVPYAMALIDKDLRVMRANEAFERHFGRDGKTPGKPIAELGDKSWAAQETLASLKTALASKDGVLEHALPGMQGDGPRRIRGWRIGSDPANPALILVVETGGGGDGTARTH
jgi:two-component system, chemotaxis family, CheB/CheR fusion protein